VVLAAVQAILAIDLEPFWWGGSYVAGSCRQRRTNMKCEFEEKQFEQHLNLQLLEDYRLLYPPGQVLENIVGFDVALYTKRRSFWRLFSKSHVYDRYYEPGSVFYRPGVRLDTAWWERLERDIESTFPAFKCNVFIQHKRPDYLKSRRSREWKDWRGPYFRYRLRKHQQLALEGLESKIGDEAIVVYASPAFHQVSALWRAVDLREVVDRTNFAQPAKLKGHTSYTYVAPGNAGKAHSDVREIQSLDFRRTLGARSERRAAVEGNRDFLISLGDIVHTILAEGEGLGARSPSGPYRRIVTIHTAGIAEHRVAVALMRVDAFCFLTQTAWRIAV
jgi:hypothetical protein